MLSFFSSREFFLISKEIASKEEELSSFFCRKRSFLFSLLEKTSFLSFSPKRNFFFSASKEELSFFFSKRKAFFSYSSKEEGLSCFSFQRRRAFLLPCEKEKLSFSFLERKRLLLKKKSFLSSLQKERLFVFCFKDEEIPFLCKKIFSLFS